jgi:glutathione synthase
MEWLAITADGNVGETAPGEDARSWLRAGQRAGHEAWLADATSLGLDGDAWVVARKLAASGRLGRATLRYLASFGAIWLQSAAGDDAALAATWAVEASGRHALRLNRPSGLRRALERPYLQRFPALCPPTLVSADPELLRAFVERHRAAVLRPVANPADARRLTTDDLSLEERIAALLAHGRLEAQPWVPPSRPAKRLFVLDGIALGAVTHPGEPGRPLRVAVEPADVRLVETLAPALRADGLHLVALDLRNGQLAGVDPSVTGLAELERNAGARMLDLLARWCDANAPEADDEDLEERHEDLPPPLRVRGASPGSLAGRNHE